MEDRIHLETLNNNNNNENNDGSSSMNSDIERQDNPNTDRLSIFSDRDSASSRPSSTFFPPKQFIQQPAFTTTNDNQVNPHHHHHHPHTAQKTTSFPMDSFTQQGYPFSQNDDDTYRPPVVNIIDPSNKNSNDPHGDDDDDDDDSNNNNNNGNDDNQDESDEDAPFDFKVQQRQPLLQQSTISNSSMSDKTEAARCLLESHQLDLFLQRVYKYFTGKGFIPLLLAEISFLLTLSFIVAFSTFLIWCVDHGLIKEKNKLSEVLVDKCISSIPILPLAFLVLFWCWWAFRVVRIAIEYPQLVEMKKFYNFALDISESDMNTITWAQVVNQLVKLKNELDTSRNPRIGKFDAHNIANRILRKENYLISMFNKDILNLTIPVFGKRKMLTRIMEWSLWICVVDFVFDEHGTVKRNFLRESNRSILATDLRKRFLLFGALNLIFSPFLLVISVLYFFFRYAEEYHKNPKLLGARHYSRFAYWTLREFNELPHLFESRINRSHQNATEYMNQFKKESVVIVARFVTFISGSFAAILAIISLIDQALLVNFEITPGGSVLFYIGVFGGIYATFNSLIPEGHQIVQPELLIKDVIAEIHYFPDEWRDLLHTEQVRNQFGKLFEYNILLFVQELLSLAFGPLIFWFSLPDSSEAIIDFFREFTVHVDSLGYVCSFAVFDFARHGNIKYGAQPGIQNERYVSRQGKMEQSFLDFKAHNPNWEPDSAGSMYLSTVLSRRNESRAAVHSNLNLNNNNSLEESVNATRRRPMMRPPRMPFGAGGTNTFRYPLNDTLKGPMESEMLSTNGAQPDANGSAVSDGVEFYGLLNDIYESNRKGTRP